jgi:hypothetical protein
MSLASDYKGYKGLPELVGLHSMEDAINKGLTVKSYFDQPYYFDAGL